MLQFEELNMIIINAVDGEVSNIEKDLSNYTVLNSANTQLFFEGLKKDIDLRSRFLVQEICKVHTKECLKDDVFQNTKIKNTFYKEGISEKVKERYLKVSFLDDMNLNLNQVSNIYTTVAAAAGTATLGGIIKYVFQNQIDIPFWTILVGSLIAGGVTFFTVVPAINKSRQEKAIDEFFVELKTAWLDWLKEVEAYYLQEVENFKANLNLQEV